MRSISTIMNMVIKDRDYSLSFISSYKIPYKKHRLNIRNAEFFAFSERGFTLSFYKNRSYTGALDTYKHASANGGKVATPLSVSGRTKESSKYNQTTSNIAVTKITKESLPLQQAAPTGKNGVVSNIDSYARYTSIGHGVEPMDVDAYGIRKADFQGTYDILDGDKLSSIVDKINQSFGIDNSSDTIKASIKREMTKYNRFKVPELNLVMSKCHGHVFFTRPSCNILNSNRQMLSEVEFDPNFVYANKSCPGLLQELSEYGVAGQDSGNEFNLLLSNTSKGFALNDETLQTNTYGTTFSGYKISYGKDDVESKTAGEFSTTFIDDKRIHVYRLHKLWVEYITNVFRGRMVPKIDNELNKILDYVASVYYILTAEDGETILFWSKYFGVYPTTIPSSQYSWQHGETLSPNEIQVTYAYSYKRDFNPEDIVAFNYNAKMTSTNYKYTRTFDTDLLMVGPTWVGAPYIEYVDDGLAEPCYKLRFR